MADVNGNFIPFIMGELNLSRCLTGSGLLNSLISTSQPKPKMNLIRTLGTPTAAGALIVLFSHCIKCMDGIRKTISQENHTESM